MIPKCKKTGPELELMFYKVSVPSCYGDLLEEKSALQKEMQVD